MRRHRDYRRSARHAFLVDALKRLEYRGYDSASVATLVNRHIDRCRAEGKLVNLEARLKAEMEAEGRRWCSGAPPSAWHGSARTPSPRSPCQGGSGAKGCDVDQPRNLAKSVTVE